METHSAIYSTFLCSIRCPLLEEKLAVASPCLAMRLGRRNTFLQLANIGWAKAGVFPELRAARVPPPFRVLQCCG
mgnify:CR=1 FL=1